MLIMDTSVNNSYLLLTGLHTEQHLKRRDPESHKEEFQKY